MKLYHAVYRLKNNYGYGENVMHSFEPLFSGTVPLTELTQTAQNC